ncbi:Bck1p [Rhizophagus irregularis DAOM 197198w]|nr:Bck1p [Rhizophagus irregularis DAOM 197198w]
MDKYKACHWYQKASENGNKNAQYNLGLCYEKGIGIEKDEIKAFYWYQKSIENGNNNAQYNLGLFYENGIGIEKSNFQAFYWYQKAAENNNKNAQYSLGLCYEKGIGIEKNDDKAFHWYQKAAENANKNAQYNLGLYYEKGVGINKTNKDDAKASYCEKNEIKAFYWYQKAAENGNNSAQHRLSVVYENGIGTEKDETKAFYWCQKAAENGNKDAQYKLSIYFNNGTVTKRDEVKAFYWYQKAVANKDEEAQRDEGEKYDVKTFEWFKKAEKESENATEWIETALKYNQVKYISYDELENVEPFFGTGAFGHISRAIWTKIHDYVICKKLSNTADIKHTLLDAFIHELKIHLQLDYSNRIVRCLGITSLDPIKKSDYLLIMQYADGSDLQSYLKDNFKNLTWDDKKKLAFQIADGLNYLHNENILHRDLHSKNIVIHEHNAKITDFGISKIQNDPKSTVYMGNFGVISYMEPKRIFDQNFPYTKSSDIYSFGVLMWEISSGYPPFKDWDKASLPYKINNGVREDTIPDTPIEYEKLYKNCWDQEPERRPTINDVLDEFEKMGFGINARNKSIKDNENLTSGLQINNESLEFTQSSDQCIKLNY